MMPMVSRKSSTPMPLSAWTFLNTSSTIIGFVGAAARPRCASSRPIPLAVASMMVTAAAITRLDPSLMCGPSLFLRLRAAVAARRLPTELLQAAPELLIELGAFAGVPVAPMTRFTRLVEVLADVPQLLDGHDRLEVTPQRGGLRRIGPLRRGRRRLRRRTCGDRRAQEHQPGARGETVRCANCIHFSSNQRQLYTSRPRIFTVGSRVPLAVGPVFTPPAFRPNCWVVLTRSSQIHRYRESFPKVPRFPVM